MEATIQGQAAGAAIEAATIADALRRTATANPDGVAVRTLDGSVSLTWSQVFARSEAIARGLAGLGVQRGDTVALLLANRPEFHICDLGAVLLGAAPFSIYNTSAPEQIEFVVSDSGARVAVTEQALLPNLLRAREHLPDLEHVIVIDGDTPAGCIALSDVEGANADFDVRASAAAVEPEDLVTLIYTSGTTGPPKGVEVTHRNLLAMIRAVRELIPMQPGMRVISWLPAAHIAERGAHHYLPILCAATVTCCPDARQIAAYLPQVRPNWFFAVPRIWEKLKAGLETTLAGQPEEQRKPQEDALAAAIEKQRLEQRGQPVPERLAALVAEADERHFAALRKALGLDEVIAVNVGAAPTPVEVLEFFHAIGLELAELWGMSESCGVSTLNPPGKVRVGTVGPPLPGVEIRLADDGELLIRGATVMKGYRNQPAKTAEAIDADGWLHTGDIGDLDDGYVKIVDRKKELIINAAGKNMSPANIESAIKTATPLIGQAVAIGDRRPYNTALIVLDVDFAPQWARQRGIEDTSLASLAGDERVRAALQEGIDEANAKLSRVEQIKRFHVVAGDWPPDGDELTATMKLKRKAIAEKYRSEIEAMYAG
ncbi:MAG: long-chain fatty acid--CoA ligase [Actinobacteria bacterium]|nr:MAG: long-chain fatty acid--CoA ligase [Actinomycetota bacterium]